MLNPFCLLFLSFTVSSYEPDVPVVDVRETDQTVEIPLGVVKVGKSTDFELKLANRSKQAFELGKPSSSCGCTAATASENLIPIDGHGGLKITVHPGEPGKFRQSLQIPITNDAGSIGTLQLVLNADAKSPVSCNLPKRIDFETDMKTKSVDFTLSPAFEDVKIFEKPFLAVGDFVGNAAELQRVDGNLYGKLHLNCDQNSGIEAMHFLKVAYSDRDGEYALTVPFSVRKRPKLSATPRSLILLKKDDAMQVRLALVGTFTKDKETNVVVTLDGKEIGVCTVTPMSERLVAIRFVVGKESALWNAPSGALVFQADKESVSVPFVLEDSK